MWRRGHSRGFTWSRRQRHKGNAPRRPSLGIDTADIKIDPQRSPTLERRARPICQEGD